MSDRNILEHKRVTQKDFKSLLSRMNLLYDIDIDPARYPNEQNIYYKSIVTLNRDKYVY